MYPFTSDVTKHMKSCMLRDCTKDMNEPGAGASLYTLATAAPNIVAKQHVIKRLSRPGCGTSIQMVIKDPTPHAALRAGPARQETRGCQEFVSRGRTLLAARDA